MYAMLFAMSYASFSVSPAMHSQRFMSRSAVTPAGSMLVAPENVLRSLLRSAPVCENS
jgi:hypothetical protein